MCRMGNGEICFEIASGSWRVLKTRSKRPYEMIFKSYIPNPPLDQFVDFFYYHENYQPDHSIDRFLPNGNVEIIIDLDDRPKYIYDNESLEAIQSCRYIWASGVRTKPISIHSGKESAMMVVYFKKGMAYPFFPLPMNEMADRVVDANLLFPAEFGFLREKLLAEKDIDARFRLTEEFLIDSYLSKLSINECVSFAIDQIIIRPDQINLGNLYQKIGYSQKHFTEMFKNHVGVTPKAYTKILRFQKAIGEVEAEGDTNWALIANDCGFYDQAHFINDFKFFSGFTPEDYLRRKNGILNYVPVN